MLTLSSSFHEVKKNQPTVCEPMLLLACETFDGEGTVRCLLLELLTQRGYDSVDPIPPVSVNIGGHTLGTIRRTIRRSVLRVRVATQGAQRRAFFVISSSWG